MKVKELINKLKTKNIGIYIERKEFYIVELFNAPKEDLNAEVDYYLLEPYTGDNPEDINCNMYIRIKEDI